MELPLICQYPAGVMLCFLKKHVYMLDNVIGPHLRDNKSKIVIGIKTYMEAWLKYPPHQSHNLHAALLAKNIWVSRTEWEVNHNHKGLILSSMLDVQGGSGIFMSDASVSFKRIGNVNVPILVGAGAGAAMWPKGDFRNMGGKGKDGGENDVHYYVCCGKLGLIEDDGKLGLIEDDEEGEAADPVNLYDGDSGDSNGLSVEEELLSEADSNVAHPCVGDKILIYELRALTHGISTMLFSNLDVTARKHRIMLDNLRLTNILIGVSSVPDDWHYEEFMKLFFYLRRLDGYQPHHIYREKNWVADGLAICARKSPVIGYSWEVSTSSKVDGDSERDKVHELICRYIKNVILAQYEFVSLIRVDRKLGKPKGIKQGVGSVEEM